MKKIGYKVQGFLLVTAISIVLIVATFSSVLIPLLFEDSSRSSLRFLKYQNKLWMDKVINGQIAEVEATAFNCTPSVKTIYFYFDQLNKSWVESSSHTEQDVVKVEINREREFYSGLKLKNTGELTEGYELLKFTYPKKRVDPVAGVVSQKQGMDYKKVIGIFRQANTTELELQIPKSVPDSELKPGWPVVSNLCKVNLELEYNPNGLKGSLRLKEDESRSTAKLLFHRRDTYPTFRTPIIIAKQVVLKDDFEVKFMSGNFQLGNFQGNWVLTEGIDNEYNLRCYLDGQKIETLMSVSYDDNFWMNNYFLDSFGQRMDIFIRLSNMMKLGANYDLDDLYQQLGSQEKGLVEGDLILTKDSHTIPVQGRPNLVLVVQGDLTIENCLINADLIMVTGNCILKNAQVNGYLMVQGKLIVNGKSGVTLNFSNNSFSNIQDELFWNNRDNYHLESVIYD